MQRVIKWRTPGFFKGIAPEVAAEEIDACANTDGYIDPSVVVERARPEDGMLHECFEWNDSVAAGKWREDQARSLISNLVIINIEDDGKETSVVRRFVHICQHEQRTGGYVRVEIALNREQDRDYLLRRAREELRSFTVKYESISELASVNSVINGFLSGDAA
jgi:hypothetical protein